MKLTKTRIVLGLIAIVLLAGNVRPALADAIFNGTMVVGNAFRNGVMVSRSGASK